MDETVETLQYRLEASTARFEQQIKRAEATMRRSAGQIERQARQTSGAFGQFSRAGSEFAASFTRAFGALAAGEGLRRITTSIVRAGDALRQMTGRFEALTGSADRASELIRGSLDIAQETGAAVASVAELATRFTIAAEEIGATDRQTLAFTSTLIKLGQIGGASAEEISRGTTQLSQALAGGIVRAEEFNSIVENTPFIARAIADALGLSIGQLRQMVLDGRLLADDVFEAILRKTQETDAAFAALPATVERSAGRMAAAWSEFAAAIDESLGLSQALARVLEVAAERINGLAAGRFGSASAEQALENIARLRREIADANAAGREDLAADLSREVAQWAAVVRQAREATAAPLELTVGGPASPSLPLDPGLAAGLDAQRRARARTIGGAAPARASGGGGRAAVSDTFGPEAAALEASIRAIEAETTALLQGEEALAAFARAKQVAALRSDLLAAAVRDGSEATAAELAEVERLADAYGDALLRMDQARASIEAKAEAERAAQRAAEDHARAVENIGNALAGAITQADSFEAALRNVAVQLANIAAQGLFGAGPLGGALGSIIPNLFGGGGTTTGTPLTLATARLPAFARGTNSAPGGMALVGEEGPELVRLPRGAQVIPARQTAAMMGGVSVVQNMSFAPGVQASDLRAEGERIKRETIAAISAARRESGRFLA